MIHPPQFPHPLPPSMFYFGAKLPQMRAAEIPGMCSVRVQDLFPDIPEPIHRVGEDTTPVREAAEAALANVDMSMIEPGDTVNILCSEHGFALMNGDAYAEVLKTIRRIVIERTGATRLRLVMGAAGTKFEQLEIIPRFGLDEAFEGHVHSFGPNDRGIPIETEIGTIYNVRRPFMAEKIIHVHYDDPRELHFHRVNGRSLKSFTMSYARAETRSVFHNNFPTRSANIIPRAIYESKFIRDKWSFAVVMSTTPAGTRTVDADNDLMQMDRRIALSLLQNYGKMIELFRSFGDCFTIHDDTRWMFYQHAGGLCACTLYESSHDHIDLEIPATRGPGFSDRRIVKDPVKAVLINTAWKFPPCADIMIGADPDVGQDLASMSPTLPNQQVFWGNDLVDSFNLAVDKAGTDKAIIFDGSYGAINMTVSLAEHLIAQAPDVSRRFEQELLPKYLRQRNLTADGASVLAPA
jgi:hypothetical protein